MFEKNKNLFFRIAKKSTFLQNMFIRFMTSIHPAIEHNAEKILILKKAFFHCELEQIQGNYFEFGVFEGSSLYAAVNIHKNLNSKIQREFIGFDSFDAGFKYFDEKDKHPFFKEGDFVSPFDKVKRRFRKWPNARFVKGYFEDTIKNKDAKEMFKKAGCAVALIDCDLMNPAYLALAFLKPALQEGSVIILDDYWAYKGNEDKGTCGALARFLKENPKIKMRQYHTYGYGGVSFIVSKVR